MDAGGTERSRGMESGRSHEDASQAVTSDEGDVDAAQVAAGADMQGIPWNAMPFSRDEYRETRRRDHATGAFELLRDVTTPTHRDARFFRFARNTRRVKCSIYHFQLRNLVWATSSHDVFVMHNASIVHWDVARRRRAVVLDLGGTTLNHGTEAGPTKSPLAQTQIEALPQAPPPAVPGIGVQTAAGTAAPAKANAAAYAVDTLSKSTVQISTIIAKDDLVVAGGFHGEVIAKRLETNTLVCNRRITSDENAITNAIEIFGTRLMTCNNDCYVRLFDLPTFAKTKEFKWDMSVNHATRQPEGKLAAVVGDCKPVSLIDGDTGENLAKMDGHEEFCFATGWHPGGRLFATGSQDRTCRIWDVRNTAQSVAVLGARMGAVRSLRFSNCGRFLAMAEARDHVHIYDVARADYDRCQSIDMFGEVGGFSFSPDSQSLFVGMNDPNCGSLLEFHRCTQDSSFIPSISP